MRTSPELHAALCALKDHHGGRDNLIVGGVYANPEAHTLWLAADELQHPERYAPAPLKTLADFAEEEK